MQTIYSFSYKMGQDGDFATTGPNAPLILDCRGLYNPHSDASLRRMTGRDSAVQHRVIGSPGAKEMLYKAFQWTQENPGRPVAFGCSYGKHRSVAMAEMLKKHYDEAQVIHLGAASMGRNV